MFKLRILPLLCLLGFSAAASSADPGVHYEIAFPNAVHHEANVTVTFSEVPRGQALEVRMSRTSPGRYALHEFAKNVYDVAATDAHGNTLVIAHPNPHQWDVSGHDGVVVVHYTLFADWADGTFTGIDATHAHLNMPATFMWARGLQDAPITIHFSRPDEDWKIATQLSPGDDSDSFSAPHLQYFMDSPTELSDFSWREWKVDRGYTVRLAVHHDGTDEQVDVFTENVKKIVEAEYQVFGGPPPYDGGTYTFIADYLPYVHGDGMEHRNSTIVIGTTPLSDDGKANLGTVAHEFFHQWNVERIRPVGIEPFNFEHVNQSRSMWFAEGVTSYYTGLSIRRANLSTTEEYAHSLSRTLNTVINAPGRSHRSASEMSQQAPMVDRSSFGDRLNYANTFISYYTWGSALGLALDLDLRTRFDQTMDGFMRAMWDVFGRNETAYRLEDIEATLADYTGDEGFAGSFFDRYVTGRDVPDYASLLGRAGFILRKKNPGKAVLGGRIADRSGDVVVMRAPVEGTPLYVAGVDEGDLILSIDGHDVTAAAYLDAVVDRSVPGDVLHIVYRQRGRRVEADVTLTEDPTLEVVTLEETETDPDGAMLELRKEWLWN